MEEDDKRLLLRLKHLEDDVSTLRNIVETLRNVLSILLWEQVEEYNIRIENSVGSMQYSYLWEKREKLKNLMGVLRK